MNNFDKELEESTNEWNKMKNKVKSVSNMITDLEKDFKVETWESAEGMSIIVDKVGDDNDELKRYILRFNFFVTGGFNFTVEKVQNEIKGERK